MVWIILVEQIFIYLYNVSNYVCQIFEEIFEDMVAKLLYLNILKYSLEYIDHGLLDECIEQCL